jgi:hypothetical protein
MSGVQWPHQTLPRDLGSIVDIQVHLWEMQQEHPADPSEGKGKGKETTATSGGQPGGPQLGDKAHPIRHPWLHYWGDVIVSELTRLNQTDEHAGAFLNDGMNEPPSDEARTKQERSKRASRVRAHAKAKARTDRSTDKS